jgi:hypothetical protein
MSKARGGAPCSKPECVPGDIVFVKKHGTEHEARSSHIVTGDDEAGRKVTVRKVLHSHGPQAKEC